MEPTTTTTTVPVDPLAHFNPDPWGIVMSIFRYVARYAVGHWVLTTVLVLSLLTYLAWRSFRQAVWGK